MWKLIILKVAAYYLEGKKLRESRNFGQVPKYLVVRRRDWDQRERREQEEILRRKEETGVMPGHTQISEEERQTLLKVIKSLCQKGCDCCLKFPRA